jgi:hypothetical protein
MKSEKLMNLEKKFNLAENLVDELSIVIEDITATELLPCPTEVVDGSAPVEASILDMGLLKQDFLLMRNNIMKLIHSGQRILDSASVLDIADLKASQLEALATLQGSLATSIKLLMDCYKDIASIEKSRQKPVSKQPVSENINNGSVTNNNIVFSGSSSDLLAIINKNLPIKELPL